MSLKVIIGFLTCQEECTHVGESAEQFDIVGQFEVGFAGKNKVLVLVDFGISHCVGSRDLLESSGNCEIGFF